ncbi:MAG: deoxyribose-phosphate aldolase [Candidatus Margulisiibacteriota bacterium]
MLISKSSDLAPYIDHTLLRKEATENDIEKLCLEAKQYDFYSVCIRFQWVRKAKELLKGTQVKVCSVVGFPLDSVQAENCHFGAMSTKEKVGEAQMAIADGANELDMVINIDALKKGDYEYIKNDINSVKKAAGNKTLKVIIETAMLNEEQKKQACQLAQEAGADYVKTSTGYVKDQTGKTLGATIEDVKLMREIVGGDFGVKASGGISDYKKAKAMIEAGANRLGCSASVEIVKE